MAGGDFLFCYVALSSFICPSALTSEFCVHVNLVSFSRNVQTKASNSKHFSLLKLLDCGYCTITLTVFSFFRVNRVLLSTVSVTHGSMCFDFHAFELCAIR